MIALLMILTGSTDRQGVCKFVTGLTAAVMGEYEGTEKVKPVLLNACGKLREGIADVCTDIVDTQLDEIIAGVESGLDTETICGISAPDEVPNGPSFKKETVPEWSTTWSDIKTKKK